MKIVRKTIEVIAGEQIGHTHEPDAWNILEFENIRLEGKCHKTLVVTNNLCMFPIDGRDLLSVGHKSHGRSEALDHHHYRGASKFDQMHRKTPTFFGHLQIR